MTNSILIPRAEITVPCLGFGVYKISEEATLVSCVTALEAGYCQIDSAKLYKNEAAVGEAVRHSSLARKAVFLTSKIAPATGGDPYENIVNSVQQFDGRPDGYLDLLLIHIPGKSAEKRKQLWLAMEKLHKEGKLRAIGVSNFHITHIEEMKAYAHEWPPHVNQIELHPWCQQRELVQYCRENDITIQAYSPLAVGSRLNDQTLVAIADKHGKSPPQVLIRWSLQHGFVALPKSQTASRIRENAQVFDFELDKGDMAGLDDLDEGAKGAMFPVNVS